MRIILKNKETLIYDDFIFKCCVGKNGISTKKIEGDKKTPKGIFSLGPLFLEMTELNHQKQKLRKSKLISPWDGVMIRRVKNTIN